MSLEPTSPDLKEQRYCPPRHPAHRQEPRHCPGLWVAAAPSGVLVSSAGPSGCLGLFSGSFFSQYPHILLWFLLFSCLRVVHASSCSFSSGWAATSRQRHLVICGDGCSSSLNTNLVNCVNRVLGLSPWVPLSSLALRFCFCFMCICVCGCHVCAGALTGQEKESDPRELELRTAVSHPGWMPEPNSAPWKRSDFS